MIKAMELRGPSCLSKAKDDEPIFVLKSTDELAPDIVREWAERYLEVKSRPEGGMSAGQYEKYKEAKALADQMEAWRASQSQSKCGE